MLPGTTRVATTPHVVRLGRPRDLNFCYDLQNRLHDAVGYCPLGGLRDRLAERRIVLIGSRTWPTGYVSYTHRRDRTTHLTQIAVEPELWLTEGGSALLDWLINAAKRAGSTALTLKCACDLPSNNFWLAGGMTPIGIRKDRRRDLILYARRLDDSQGPLPFPPLPQLRKGKT